MMRMMRMVRRAGKEAYVSLFLRVCAPALTDITEPESAPATTQLGIFPLAHMHSLVLTGAPPPLHFAPFSLHTCPRWCCSGPCRPGIKEPCFAVKSLAHCASATRN